MPPHILPRRLGSPFAGFQMGSKSIGGLRGTSSEPRTELGPSLPPQFGIRRHRDHRFEIEGRPKTLDLGLQGPQRVHLLIDHTINRNHHIRFGRVWFLKSIRQIEKKRILGEMRGIRAEITDPHHKGGILHQHPVYR